MAVFDIVLSSSAIQHSVPALVSCNSLLTACHQGSLYSIHRFVQSKVSKDKSMISPSLVTVSKASSGTFDGITLCTERSDCQLILALARHRGMRSGHEIVLLGGW